MKILREQVRRVVQSSLDDAEEKWRSQGHLLSESHSMDGVIKSHKDAKIGTDIPNYPIIEEGSAVVDGFIAFVVDIRNSTQHLLTHEKGMKVEPIQRVFYETSALLPACSFLIQANEGSVTEYLGDGLLAMFHAPNAEKEKTARKVFTAAESILEIARPVVNEALKERYELPALNIGIGLAYSQAMVTTVGLPGQAQPTVFGGCVYKASKRSDGMNKALIDEKLEAIWPTSKNGRLKISRLREGTFQLYP